MTAFESGVGAVGIDATMIAVRNIDQARAMFAGALSSTSTEPEYITSGNFYRCFVPVPGGGQLQLMQPGEGERVVSEFLESRGEGLYGLVVGVRDIEQAFSWLQSDPDTYTLVGGLVDLDGMREVIIHPKSMCGVLTVLRQRLA